MGPAHYAVVTVEKEVYTWSVGACNVCSIYLREKHAIRIEAFILNTRVFTHSIER